MAKVTVSVRYSYREYANASVTISGVDPENIDEDQILDALIRQEGLSEDAETQVERADMSWGFGNE